MALTLGSKSIKAGMSAKEKAPPVLGNQNFSIKGLAMNQIAKAGQFLGEAKDVAKSVFQKVAEPIVEPAKKVVKKVVEGKQEKKAMVFKVGEGIKTEMPKQQGPFVSNLSPIQKQIDKAKKEAEYKAQTGQERLQRAKDIIPGLSGIMKAGEFFGGEMPTRSAFEDQTLLLRKKSQVGLTGEETKQLASIQKKTAEASMNQLMGMTGDVSGLGKATARLLREAVERGASKELIEKIATDKNLLKGVQSITKNEVKKIAGSTNSIEILGSLKKMFIDTPLQELRGLADDLVKVTKQKEVEKVLFDTVAQKAKSAGVVGAKITKPIPETLDEVRKEIASLENEATTWSKTMTKKEAEANAELQAKNKRWEELKLKEAELEGGTIETPRMVQEVENAPGPAGEIIQRTADDIPLVRDSNVARTAEEAPGPAGLVDNVEAKAGPMVNKNTVVNWPDSQLTEEGSAIVKSIAKQTGEEIAVVESRVAGLADEVKSLVAKIDESRTPEDFITKARKIIDDAQRTGTTNDIEQAINSIAAKSTSEDDFVSRLTKVYHEVKPEPEIKPLTKQQRKMMEEAFGHDLGYDKTFVNTQKEAQYQEFKSLRLRNLDEIEDVDNLKRKRNISGEKSDSIFYSQDQSSDEVFSEFKDRLLAERHEASIKGVPEVEKVVEKRVVEEGRGITKVAKSIEQKAKDFGMAEKIGELAGYDKKTVAAQVDKIDKMIADDIDNVRAIIRGEKPLPGDLTGSMIIARMEEHIIKTNNVDLMVELANSPLATRISEAAQELRFAGERLPDSATVRLQEIKKLREEKAARRTSGGTKAGRERTVASIKKEISAAELSEKEAKTWDRFLDSITC